MKLIEDMNRELNEFNQPTNNANPTDMAPPKRYNANSGKMSAIQSKTQRITRTDRLDLVKSKDLDTLVGQMDVSFKQILAAADNTGNIEQFIIGRLNQVRQQVTARVAQEKKKQAKQKK